MTEPLLVEVDQIYHLACPASPIFYKYNPVKVIYYFFMCTYHMQEMIYKHDLYNLISYFWQTIKTNVIGTLNMLGLAKRVGARYLQT